jgi:hypothetical protein
MIERQSIHAAEVASPLGCGRPTSSKPKYAVGPVKPGMLSAVSMGTPGGSEASPTVSGLPTA